MAEDFGATLADLGQHRDATRLLAAVDALRALRDAVLIAPSAQGISDGPREITRSVTGLAWPQITMVAVDAA